MKLFTKIFLGIMAVATLAVGIAQFMSVYISFKSGVEREQNGLQEQHLTIDYMLRLYWSENDDADDRWSQTVSQVQGFISEGYSISIINSNNEAVYGSLEEMPEDLELSENSINLRIKTEESRYEMISSGLLSLEEGVYTLHLKKDVSVIFEEKANLQRYGILIYVVVMFICIWVAYLISRLITKPIKKLRGVAESMANGEHNIRTHLRTQDEIGALGKSFDTMAQTVEENIKTLKAQAREKEDFVANFAHELKTPLTSIIGYADLIYREDLSDKKLKESASYIISEGMRLESMSFKLLDLSSVEKLNIERELVETRVFFENVAEATGFIMQERGVGFSYSCEPAYINVDFNLFKSLVLNLLDNASKSGADRVWLKGFVMGRWYRISVLDNGSGIPEQELDRIEEAFYMVDKARSRKMNGAGIGLALSSKIAKAHETALQYTSELGKGTTVSVDLIIEEGEYEE